MQRILGQARAIETLDKALRSGRFHHAWIFSGPRGVGKFTAAVEVARLLLDPEATQDLGDQLHSPPPSRAAQLIDSGAHPDLHVIRKELALFSDNPDVRARKQMNIPVDLLRELMLGGRSGEKIHEGPAYRTAAMGHGKVFIVDEAELIDETGQNTMLKTLEEPPPRTYLFLITTRPDRLLPTVRSRCHLVRFVPLDQPAMRQWLALAVEQYPQLKELSGEQLDCIMQLAEGSPGVALLAAQYGFHQWIGRLRPMLADLARGAFPPALGETLAEFIDEFAIQWVKNHANASKDSANKDGCRHVLSLLASEVRRNLAQASAGGGDAEPWLSAIDLIAAAERHIEAHVNIKLALENMAVQWANRAARPAAA